jgi:hypothetical protein
MQNVAGKFMAGERVQNCLRNPIGHTVNIKHNIQKDSYGYRNLETCASVWMCPVCAAKISEKRRVELCEAVSTWQSRGFSVAMATITVQHSKRDSYKKTLAGLQTAYGKLLNSKACKTVFAEMGVVGRIKALEVTFGENGWHPHIHLLLFITSTNPPLDQFKGLLFKRWEMACKASNLNKPSADAFDLSDGSYAARYVSKWGIESEMTKGHIKTSKTGYSPFDLLRSHLGEYHGNAKPLAIGQDKELFKEYAYTMKGKRQLVWSDGLRDLLGLKVEKTDKELVDETEEQEILFTTIPLEMWKIILKAEKRGEVLESCKAGLDSFYRCCKKIYLESHNEN